MQGVVVLLHKLGLKEKHFSVNGALGSSLFFLFPFLIRLLNCRRKNLYTILWLESLRSYARYVFKTLISMMARFHVKSWVFCGRVIREKKWFILKTPQCVLVTHRLVAHGSCKVPDDKSFIVPHVPVDGQLRLPGYLQDTHTHLITGGNTHTHTHTKTLQTQQSSCMLPIYDGKLIPSPANHSLLGRLRFDASNLTVSEITSLSGFTSLHWNSKLQVNIKSSHFLCLPISSILSKLSIKALKLRSHGRRWSSLLISYCLILQIKCSSANNL